MILSRAAGRNTVRPLCLPIRILRFLTAFLNKPGGNSDKSQTYGYDKEGRPSSDEIIQQSDQKGGEHCRQAAGHHD